MKERNENTYTKITSKNQLFKKKVIIKPDDLKKILPNVFETEKDTIRSNTQYNQIFNDLFDENKFKIRNDFDKKHSKVFLNEKDLYLQSINLDDYLSDEDEDVEFLNRISPKFTFGHQ